MWSFTVLKYGLHWRLSIAISTLRLVFFRSSIFSLVPRVISLYSSVWRVFEVTSEFTKAVQNCLLTRKPCLFHKQPPQVTSGIICTANFQLPHIFWLTSREVSFEVLWCFNIIGLHHPLFECSVVKQYSNHSTYCCKNNNNNKKWQ